MKLLNPKYANYVNLQISEFKDYEIDPLIFEQDEFVSSADFIKILTGHELSGVLFNDLMKILLKQHVNSDVIPLSLLGVLFACHEGFTPGKDKLLNKNQRDVILSEVSEHMEYLCELFYENSLNDIDDLINYDNESVNIRGKKEVYESLIKISAHRNSLSNILDLFSSLIYNKIKNDSPILIREGYQNKRESYFCRHMSNYLYEGFGIKGYQVIANFTNILFEKNPHEYFTIQTVAQRVHKGRERK